MCPVLISAELRLSLPVQLQELGAVQPFLEGAGVFARMSPDDKRTLMELLGDGSVGDDGGEVAGLGHHVGFCGDGANDVGALKAAHVGVSLCEAEASVAAPLTSKRQTIACMVTVIAEGRCSLITSYIIFKFIIVYAFIQVGGVGVFLKRGQGRAAGVGWGWGWGAQGQTKVRGRRSGQTEKPGSQLAGVWSLIFLPWHPSRPPSFRPLAWPSCTALAARSGTIRWVAGTLYAENCQEQGAPWL